jgi:hypothetical protein
MRAHRLRVTVPESHELRLHLPSDFPTGDAEVIVLEACSSPLSSAASSTCAPPPRPPPAWPASIPC